MGSDLGMNRADLFHRDHLGRLLKRKEGICSSIAPACLDCGTTEKKHEIGGRCRNCYLRHKRATDPQWRARVNHNKKLADIDRAEIIWERDRRRNAEAKNDPRKKALRKARGARYWEKRSKWPLGGQVAYELIAGHWVTGTIIEKTRGMAHVQFKTYSEWIGKKKLRSLVQRVAA